MLRALLLPAALGVLSLNALAAQDTSKTPPPKTEVPKTEVKAEEKASIEVYRLKVVEPNDALQALQALVGHGNTLPRRPRSVDDPVGPGGGRGTRGGGGGFSGPSSSALAEPRSATGIVCHGLADLRTRSLVVRGTEKDQQLAADLVAILDTPEGKPLPTVKLVHAFRLENLDANDLVAILQVLDPTMTYRLAPVARMKLLLASGTDEQMKELADAVKKLDVPGITK